MAGAETHFEQAVLVKKVRVPFGLKVVLRRIELNEPILILPQAVVAVHVDVSTKASFATRRRRRRQWA